MAKLGVHIYEKATSLQIPVVADVGIPFVAGIAPVQSAGSPAKSNTPVLCTSWDEAVEQLGFSNDWEKYTLCEFMYSHFQLFGCQPVIFCNVLDAERMKHTVTAREVSVVNHQASLPIEAISSSLSVYTEGKADIVSAVSTAAGGIGKKDGLTGGSVSFDDKSRTLKVVLDGAVSELKNTGAFDAISQLVSGGYTVTIDGVKITGANDFKKTATWTSLSSISVGTSVSFIVKVSKNGEAVEYGAVVSYPDSDGNAVGAVEINLASAALEEGTDYSVFYDRDDNDTYVCMVELLEYGSAYNESSISVTYDAVEPETVTMADIVEGLGEVDSCMTQVGVIPDLICAPGWSHNTVVAAVMATKANGINGLFHGKAVIDCDCGETGVRRYSELTPYKNRNNFVDENQIVCWPMVKLGNYKFHLSTQLAGLMASVDAENEGIPYESPSNKSLKMDACILEDGTEVNLTWNQVELIAGSYGVVTALNFMSMGWTAKGNYTGCYPGNTDVKDQFIPVSRMFDFVGNTLIRTFWNMLDKPMTRRLLGTIQNSAQIWLNGLVATERLLGARVEILESENTTVDLMAGILHIHIYLTPPSPAQEIDFTLEYDVDYVSALVA